MRGDGDRDRNGGIGGWGLYVMGRPGDNAAEEERSACGAGGEDPVEAFRKPFFSTLWVVGLVAGDIGTPTMDAVLLVVVVADVTSSDIARHAKPWSSKLRDSQTR